MKILLLHFIALILLLAPFHIMAQTATDGATKCIKMGSEIQQVPKIQDIVTQLGGIDNLQGNWKLGGLPGQFKSVAISFESASDGLKALINGLDPQKEPKWSPISVCDTIREDTLQIKILKTQDSLYMRMGNTGSLELAQISAGKVGNFYSFIKE